MAVLNQSPEAITSRIEQLERDVKRLRVVTSVLVTFVILFILGLIVPELVGGLLLIGTMLAIAGGMMLFISAIMWLLEWWSPSGRLDEMPTTITTTESSPNR